MGALYSRVGSASLKKETTENTPVTPDVFFGLNEEDISAPYGYTPATPIAANRAMNIRAVKNLIAAPEGTLTLNVEPKTIGYFLAGVFGGLSSGRYLPFSGLTGTFSVGETVTGGTSAATGVVVFVSEDYLIVTPTGTFSAAETITGGTSSATATVTAYSSSVYAHASNLPKDNAYTYTVQINLADSAVRYIGCRFVALDAVAQADNIITAGVKMMARGQFRHAKVTAVTSSGAGSKTITVDQTYGLVASDSIKVYRPSTGAFLDFASSGVKTHSIASVASALTITVTNLQTSLAVGDLIVLAPQTASYTVGAEFPWIGGAEVFVGDALSSVATDCVEDFTLVVSNDYEARHCAKGDDMEDRFPQHLIQKGLTSSGTLKMHYKDEDFIRNLRTSTAQAIKIKCLGALIGSTTIKNEIRFSMPEVQFDPYATNLSSDEIVGEEVPFTGFYNSTAGAQARVLLVNDVSSYS